jgi:hypothetical protein
VTLDDLLADRQADAGPGIDLPRVETLEDRKDPLSVLGLDPDPVVGHGKHP